ncbi:uncharacterized protein LOC111453886 [Cucurbita moschata]|uniref:rhamnogalacturonan endolyase n=1 Tax=Cucurbita moschata TaxID=3662 RepID=A0A6J1GG74_CUCMO|nr:uncharacterized protein LOC111453886 [Cucurbita moschata]
MEKRGKARRQHPYWTWKLGFSAMPLLFLFFSLTLAHNNSSQRRMVRKLVKNNESMLSRDVTLEWENRGQVVMDNGLVRITLSRPEGNVIALKYNALDNLLEIRNPQYNRGYWDVVWNRPNRGSATDRVRATNFKVITATADQIELSFTKTWNPNSHSSCPLNIDKRYILRRGDSGFYAYAIFERLDGWPQIDVDQIRIVFKILGKKFHYMVVSDDRQRIMPTARDRETGHPLAYREAVLLTQPINSKLKGEVDDKYQYSLENMENKVHGWESMNPHVGFWMITPSDEFRTAGPVKQDLTSHVGPTTLSMRIETSKWPYSFVGSTDFPSSNQRGTVSGRLLVRDRHAKKWLMWGDSAYVGLAAPGELGSWQTESKGYQFWTRADGQGYFSINNIRPGNYNLYAWVPGVIGDYKYANDITVTLGSTTRLGLLIYDPPRQGPTLWEIGVPDRTAAEFYIPDPQPTLMNRFYNNSDIHTPDKFRQYGLWERYAELFPHQDLVYNVATDDYRRHWFFAHVTRATRFGTYQATTWQIVFRLQGPKQSGNYMLRLALASTTEAVVEIRFNNPLARGAHFSTGYWASGRDNAIARHGIHGLYWLFNFKVPSGYLVEDENIIYLTQRRHMGPFQGVMYDYIRFEGVQ